MRGRWRAVVLAAVALLAGCTSPGPATTTGAAAGASASPPDLAAIAVEIRQDRASWGPRVVQVHVTYAGAEQLEVTGAALTTAGIAGTSVSGPVTKLVPPGGYRDVDVPLDTPVCDGSPASAATVTLTVLDGARSTQLTANATDPNGHLARIHDEDCAAAAFAAGADVRFTGFRLDHRDGAVVGLVTLEVDPVSGGPPVAVTRIDQTILLQPAGEATSWSPPELDPVTASTTVTLEVRPGRCDPHAVAEDKRGTFFGLRTAVDGAPQPVFYLQLPQDLRGTAHDFIGVACGW